MTKLNGRQVVLDPCEHIETMGIASRGLKKRWMRDSPMLEMSRNRSAKIERPPRLVKQRHESVAVTEAVILLALQAAMTMVGPAPCKPESIWGFVARAWMVSAFVWPDHACRGACTAIGSTYNLRSRWTFPSLEARENTWCGRQGGDWCTFMTICTWPTYNKQGAWVRWPSFCLGLYRWQVFLTRHPTITFQASCTSRSKVWK